MCDFEGCGAQGVEEVEAVGKSVGLDFNGGDTEELAEDPEEQLLTAECRSALHREQQKMPAEEHPLRRTATGGVSSDVAKSIVERRMKARVFEKHHLDVGVMIRIL